MKPAVEIKIEQDNRPVKLDQASGERCIIYYDGKKRKRGCNECYENISDAARFSKAEEQDCFIQHVCRSKESRQSKKQAHSDNSAKAGFFRPDHELSAEKNK